MIDRYARQVAFYGINREGQDLIGKAKIAIIGLGALGTVTANNLSRSGVGYIKLIDRDYVELNNLCRQILYDEYDAKEEKPKAIASYEHLKIINSEIFLEPIIAHVDSTNIIGIIKDTDLVIDATDNVETRLIINEACNFLSIPWIYGGVLSSFGMTMNILPGNNPCYRCLMPQNDEGKTSRTCATDGVLNSITSIIGSIQSAEAIKIITKSPSIRKEMVIIDIWENKYQKVCINKNQLCPTCVKKEYTYLGKMSGIQAVNLCGSSDIEICLGAKVNVDFQEMKKSLEKSGIVTITSFSLEFKNAEFIIKLYSDGRAIIKNARDLAHAKAIYSQYIGL